MLRPFLDIMNMVGTMIIWIPLVIYLFAIGQNNMAIGLLLYSIIVTGNIDYIARITIMKKMGDVHPIITILGVIVGFNLSLSYLWGGGEAGHIVTQNTLA